jgi:outer membrane protein assembly factor BamC
MLSQITGSQNMRFSSPRWLLPLLAALSLGGCGMFPSTDELLPDRQTDYKKERMVEADLEVPPDLTRSSIRDALAVPGSGPGDIAVYSQYNAQQRPPGSVVRSSEVLPSFDRIVVERDGTRRWLRIDSPPDQVWSRVVAFWRDNGILLVQEDPTVGVMETGWIENRADIKTDFITKTLRGLFEGLYAAATRDQFRVRLEDGPHSGVTELYLTHRGMQQKITSANDSERPVWEARPNDPELEAVMLRRIMVYLGAANQKAEQALGRTQEQTPRAQLVKDRDGAALLIVEGDFNTAWRVTGVALDRVGFAVEDRDRSAGIYFVHYRDPQRTQPDEGLLSKLAFWSKDKVTEQEYRVKLVEIGGQTQVVVLDAKGERDLSSTATRILTLLHEQIR